MSKVGNITSHSQNFVTTAITNRFPEMTIKSDKANRAIDWIGRKISSPENRLILGVTALMTQPYIDGHNDKVDSETRKVSVARTFAKIIAGTLTGYFVRLGAIKSIDAFSKMPNEIGVNTKFKKLRQIFTPDAKHCAMLKHNLEHYKNAYGTILALVVMIFTNFAIDAPLTKFLTNKFTAKINERQAENKKSGEVANA